MKRIALIVLILAGMALTVNGCSKKDETTEPATEAVQPAQKAVAEQAPSTPAPVAEEESAVDSAVSEAVGQMEQTGEALIEEGKQMAQEMVDTASEKVVSEADAKLQELTNKATEKIGDAINTDAATKTMEDTLKKKAEEKGIKLP